DERSNFRLTASAANTPAAPASTALGGVAGCRVAGGGSFGSCGSGHGHVIRPGTLQLSDVFGVDLLERGVTGPGQIVTEGGPIGLSEGRCRDGRGHRGK